MGIDWTEEERGIVAQGMVDHPMKSGRCAALARVVHAVAKPRDPNTRTLQLRPPRGARWLVPKSPYVPYWCSHTLVETQGHDVDAITGPDGHAASEYFEQTWHFHEQLEVKEVDVMSIDRGIQDSGS